MEIAGLRLAEFIKKKSQTKVFFFIGPGNNGGDGLVAARFLHSWNISVEIILIKEKSKYSKTSQDNLKYFTKSGIPITLFCKKTLNKISSKDTIIDALLGTSLLSKPKKSIQHVLETINKCKSTKISVDVPSGLNSTTGKLYKHHIEPNYILSFMAPKKGFKTIKHSKIFIADIGININTILKDNKF